MLVDMVLLIVPYGIETIMDSQVYLNHALF